MPRVPSVITVSRRVAGLHVDEVGPRAEDAQRPQLAPVLVRHQIVGIVGPGALVPESAEHLAGQQAPGGEAVRPVGPAVGALEHLVDVVLRHRRPLARWAGAWSRPAR